MTPPERREADVFARNAGGARTALARASPHRGRGSRKVFHARLGTGGANKPASKRRWLWRRQRVKRCSTASTGNLHDCGVNS